MRTSELREWLEHLEESPAPEPSALFVAKLEADLRAMDQAEEAEAPRRTRTRRARVLVAAGPVAALTAAAAAAAVTLLPSRPHPNEVKTADPGVTAPAPPTEQPSPSVATTTTLVAPPWLPPAASPSPTTTAVPHEPSKTPAASPAEHPAPTVVAPDAPVTTTAPRATTTVPAGPETLSLHCTAAVAGGNPVVGCGWSQSTSPSFKWYRLWRESQGSSPTIVFQSDNRSTTKYYDQAVQAGTNYYYKLDITDAAGNVIGSSSVAPVTCC